MAGIPSTTERALGAPRLPYLPGIDGLRAVAVIAVLLYHAGLPLFAGGFLGVEVFFVISGFLITSLLLAEWGGTGGINLPGFWLRRARRLLPAAYALVVVVLVVAVVFLRDEVATLRGDGAAALTYVTNWYLIFNERSYFEAMGRPSLLQHLWSLAVEEQFYLVWPPVLALMLRYWRRGVILAVVLAGAATSSLLMALLYNPEADPSRVYYGTDTRATGLLIGAALAFVWSPWRLRSGAGTPTSLLSRAYGALLDLAGLAALAGLAVFFTSLDEFQPFLFQGGFAALALATIAAIGVAVHPLARLVPWLLGLPPMRYVGLRSYSIYLWHWPVFMLTRPHLDVPFDGAPLFVLRMGLTLALAEASYRVIEVPCRAGALGRMWRSLHGMPGVPALRLAARRLGAVAACAGLVLVGAAVVNAQPPPPPEELAAGSISVVFTADPTPPPSPERPAVAQRPVEPTQPSTANEPDVAHAPELARSATPVPATATATAVVADAVPWIDVNVRSGPGKAYAGVTVAHKGEALAVLGRTADAGWFIVRTSEGVQGWAYADPLTLYKAVDLIPVAGIPAMPQATALPATAILAAPIPTPSPTVVIVAGVQPATPAPNAQDDPGGVFSTLPPPAGTEQPQAPVTPLPEAQPSPWPTRDPGPVLAVGDSVMLGAAREIGQALGNVEVNAAVSRQVSSAIFFLQARSNAGLLPNTVVIHMGTNGIFSARQFDQMMSALANVPRVVFLNVRVPRAWETPNNKVIAEGVARYPNAVLVDWYAATEGHPELFSKDGVHLQPPGRRIYAGMIADAVKKADPTPTPAAALTPTAPPEPTPYPTFPPGIDPTLPTPEPSPLPTFPPGIDPTLLTATPPAVP
jgi:peptidoglycan/LPS O-acetylase OafA/YrhL